MKTLALTAAVLATLVTVAPVQAVTAGELPQFFNDQGEQVPSFPNGRFANTPTVTAQAQVLATSGHLPATFNDQGQQVPAFPSRTSVAADNSGASKTSQICSVDSRKAASC